MLRSVVNHIKTLSISEKLVNSKIILRTICTTNALNRQAEDRREMLRSMPAPDEGTAGEKAIDIDRFLSDKHEIFPDEDLPKRLFNGVQFKDLPIFNIRVSPNNTILSLTDSKGVPKIIRSCGIEGFKNTRKGTNIAAQATAISIATRALEKGVKTIRVRVRGLGPGRMSAIKGLEMAGMDIVSITDNTRVTWQPLRARKQRKL